MKLEAREVDNLDPQSSQLSVVMRSWGPSPKTQTTSRDIAVDGRSHDEDLSFNGLVFPLVKSTFPKGFGFIS